jgi:hypothetical protein
VSNHKRWSPVHQFRDRGGISASARSSIFGIEIPARAETGFRDLVGVQERPLPEGPKPQTPKDQLWMEACPEDVTSGMR